METLLKISKAVDATNLAIARGVKWLVLITAALSAFNALARKFFHIGSNALLEAQWYLFAAIFLLYAGTTLLQQDHVRVDLFYRKYSAKTKCVLEIVGAVFCIFPLAGVVIYLGSGVFWTAFVENEVSVNPGGLAIWPARLLVPAGFSLLAAQAVSEIIKNVVKLREMKTVTTPTSP